MKKLTVEEAKAINGGVKNTRSYGFYWGSQCSICGIEYYGWGLIVGKAIAIEKAHACELEDAKYEARMAVGYW